LDAPELVRSILDDPSTAAIDDKLRATLGFLRTMTLTPDALTADDARAVLATGVTREALRDAIHVAFLFNVYDRLADTLGWHVPPEGDDAYEATANRLLERGY
jgi:alkylhydroperoxidase family enzyme